jgi:hypothetical protein
MEHELDLHQDALDAENAAAAAQAAARLDEVGHSAGHPQAKRRLWDIRHTPPACGRKAVSRHLTTNLKLFHRSVILLCLRGLLLRPPA